MYVGRRRFLAGIGTFGYAKPPLFLAVYRYVVEKGYEMASLRDWIKARGAN